MKKANLRRSVLRSATAAFTLVTSLLLASPRGDAASLVWDADPVTPGNQDGGGVWSLLGTNWNASTAAWTNLPADVAVFGAASGAAGEVTVPADVIANNLTFQATGSGSYVIRGTGGVLRSGNATTGTLSVLTDAELAIPVAVSANHSLTKTGNATLTLSGTSPSTFAALRVGAGTVVLSGAGGSFVHPTVMAGPLANTSNASLIRVTSGNWTSGEMGTNNTNSSFRGTLEVLGGSITFANGRFIGEPAGRSRIVVNGGVLRFLQSSGVNPQFAPGSAVSSTAGPATVEVQSGLLDVATSTANSLGGAWSGQFLVSGGEARIGVATGPLGTVRDFRIGGSTANSRSAVHLTGGTLTVAGTISAPAAAATGGVNNLNLRGGVLAAAGITTANLGSTSNATNPVADSVAPGVLVNHATTLAPGGQNIAGRTVITGSVQVLGGGVDVDVRGLVQANAFRAGDYDFLSITGNATLGGNLSVGVGLYTPGGTDSFTVLTAGSLSGAFANVPFGSRLLTTDERGTFEVARVGNSVVVRNWVATPPPSLAQAPQNAEASIGGNVTFTASATGDGTITYQWYRLVAGSWVAVPGATGASLSVGPVAAVDSGTQYGVVATNAGGSTAPVGAVLTVRTPPVVVQSPSAASTIEGTAVTFTANATAYPSPTVQWYVNSGSGFQPVAGATSASLVVTPVKAQDGTQYKAVFTNSEGSTDSATALLSVDWNDVYNITYTLAETGPREPVFNFSGVRRFSPAPAFGVHPRIYFGPDELPDIRNRLRTSAPGIEGMKQIGAYTKILELGPSYDRNAAYAKDASGTARISNTGLFDRKAGYDALALGNATVANAYDGTGKSVLAALMSVEAFECLINSDIDPAGTSVRLTKLARAMEVWAASKLPDPALNHANRSLLGGVAFSIAYDLAYNAMTPTQRDTIRQAVAKIAPKAGEIWGVGITPCALTSNWAALNSYQLPMLLAFEGEPGFVEDRVHEFAEVYYNFLTYGYGPSGAIYEGEGKGFVFATEVISLAKRGYNFFGHPHMRAYAQKRLPSMLQPYGFAFTLGDTLGGSGTDVVLGKGRVQIEDVAGLRYVYPNMPEIDFVWRNMIEKNGGYDFINCSPRGSYSTNLIQTVVFALPYSPLTWAQHSAQTQKPAFIAADRGLVDMRSAVDTPNAMQLQFFCRQNMGGHTYADRNSFALSALGRLWVRVVSTGNSLFIGESRYHSMPLVNGLGVKTNPKEGQKARQPQRLAAVVDNPLATFATGDATYAYSWEYDWSATQNATSAETATVPSGWSRVTETYNSFLRDPIADPHYDIPFYKYPAWNAVGKVEFVLKKAFNPLFQAYRTAGVVRNGSTPYALLIDDIQRNTSSANYTWLAQIPDDLNIVSATASNGQRDIILAPTSGTGRLLVRFLRENASAQAPAATDFATLVSGNTTYSFKRLVVNTTAVNPGWIVMLYPHNAGDALPVTTNVSPTVFETAVGGSVDRLTLHPRTTTANGNSVTMTEFTIERGGSVIVDTRNTIRPMGAP